MLQRSIKSGLEVTWQGCYNIASKSVLEVSWKTRMLQRSIKSSKASWKLLEKPGCYNVASKPFGSYWTKFWKFSYSTKFRRMIRRTLWSNQTIRNDQERKAEEHYCHSPKPPLPNPPPPQLHPSKTWQAWLKMRIKSVLQGGMDRPVRAFTGDSGPKQRDKNILHDISCRYCVAIA